MIFNLMGSIILVILYYFGYLQNIRENSGSYISYGSALITLNGVFLTLLVTLKGSLIFIRLKQFFPKLHKYLYIGLKKQVISCIIFVLINLLIATVGPTNNLIIILFGIICWSFYLVDISIGALYNLRVVTNLTLDKDSDDIEKPLT